MAHPHFHGVTAQDGTAIPADVNRTAASAFCNQTGPGHGQIPPRHPGPWHAHGSCGGRYHDGRHPAPAHAPGKVPRVCVERRGGGCSMTWGLPRSDGIYPAFRSSARCAARPMPGASSRPGGLQGEGGAQGGRPGGPGGAGRGPSSGLARQARPRGGPAVPPWPRLRRRPGQPPLLMVAVICAWPLGSVW
jgi:hypothetical protein